MPYTCPNLCIATWPSTYARPLFGGSVLFCGWHMFVHANMFTVLRGKSPAEILHLLSNLFWDCSNDTKKGVSNRLRRKKTQKHCKTWDEIAKIKKNVRPSVSAGPCSFLISFQFWCTKTLHVLSRKQSGFHLSHFKYPTSASNKQWFKSSKTLPNSTQIQRCKHNVDYPNFFHTEESFELPILHVWSFIFLFSKWSPEPTRPTCEKTRCLRIGRFIGQEFCAKALRRPP